MQPGSQELLSAAAGAPGRIPLVRDVLERFGQVRIRAHGGSMRPAIVSGEILTVRRPGLTAVGDVVLFERDGRLFAHRVVDRTPCGRVRTRGDAHCTDDPWIDGADVLGVVESVTAADGARRPCPAARPRLIDWLRGPSTASLLPSLR